MTTFDIYLKKYRWSVRFYLKTDERNVPSILSFLQEEGYPESSIDRVYSSLAIQGYNTGLTVADIHNKKACVVVSKATDSGEFFNTFIHEVKHLVDFISLESGIPLTGEEGAYLIGFIGRELYPKLEKYLCSSY